MNRALAFVVAGSLLLATGCGSKNDASKTDGQAAAGADLQPDFTLSTTQLMKEFAADAAAASQKYTGKVLELDGPIEDPFYEDPNGQSFIILGATDDKDFTWNFQCGMPADSGVKLDDLWKGQTATIKGKCTFQMGAVVFLTDCRAVKFGDPIPVLTVSAKQLLDECQKDQAAFDKKYKGKVLKIAGVVAKIDPGDPHKGIADEVQIKGDEASNSKPPLITFHYTTPQARQVNKLKEGGPITIKATSHGMTDRDINIELNYRVRILD